jgi:hypothetical protein
MTDQVAPFLETSRAIGTPSSDNALRAQRGSRYGESFVQPIMPWRQALADEGSYHYFHNATNDASTTLAGHAAPVLADADATMTKPFIFLRNLLSSGKRIYLDFIEIQVVTAGANGTTASWAAQVDTGATRVSSGGTALTVGTPNGQATSALDTSALTILGGPVVTGAESSAVREIGHGDLRPTIEVAGDLKVFDFVGDYAVPAAAAAAAIRTQVQRMPPVILGYTDQLLLALYAPSQSVAGVYKVRGGLWVR